ncbi:NDR1/HIN1-like protein 13, partial [Mucuna pruriens]
MTDRVHPSAKPTANANANAVPKPTFRAYRPQQQQHRRRSRGCAGTLCCWLLMILLLVLLLAGGAGSVLYLLYRPQRPTFSVTSLKVSSLNLSSPTSGNAEFDLTLSTTNPNDRILFSYDPTSVSILSGHVALASATIPSFLHHHRNTTVLETSITSTDQTVDSDAATLLKSKTQVALTVKLETKVEADMGLFQTPRVGIRVLCDGVTVSLPVGDKPATASSENTECQVNVRFKVWKWTVG